MITVGIVEDNEPARRVFERLIRESDGMCCSFASASGEDALKEIQAGVPDVLLVDIHLPGISGVEVARKVHLKYPEARIIMLTGDGESSSIVAALEAGANGYLLKCSSMEEIVNGIMQVFRGGVTFTSEVARKMIATVRERTMPGV